MYLMSSIIEIKILMVTKNGDQLITQNDSLGKN
jgi:hypothetical protein